MTSYTSEIAVGSAIVAVLGVATYMLSQQQSMQQASMINHVVKGKRFNPGESSIDILANGGFHFVDKTLTINQFLTGPGHQLILRPRRCGKSHAISLLQAFLQAPSLDEAQPTTLGAPFKGTLIDGENYKDLVKEHYKAYPVLHINLKEVNGLSLDEMFQRLRLSLLTSLWFCRAQLKRKMLDSSYFCQLIDKQGDWQRELEFAPFQISETLHMLYGRPAIVLIDEYDAPLNDALQYKYMSEASKFFGNMFSRLLKDNLHVAGSFTVGILKLAKSGWLSGLNNVKVFSLDAGNPHYGDSFLFTEQEVQEFLQKTDSPLQLEDLKKYYNSYCARGPGRTSISLFNPWSVHHAIAENRLDCYWNQTSSYMPIRKAIWMRGPDHLTITKLLAGESVQLQTCDTVTYADLDKLEEKEIWGLLSYAGYLTPIFVQDSPSSNFRIPNFEVRQEWISWLRDFIQEKGGRLNDIKTLLNPFLQGNAAQAQKALSKLLLEHFSYFLHDASHPEKVYQVFLFGLLLSEFGREPGSYAYVVDMEKEAAYGQYDIRCWSPLRDHQTEIIIELKAVSLSKKRNNTRIKKTKKELEKHMRQQLNTAMEHLESRAYYLTSGKHVTTVHEFGICFAGKLCVVGVRTRTRIKDGTNWIATDCTVPGAQFQESEIERQMFDTVVEEQLEKQDKVGIHGQREDEYVEPTTYSPSHHTDMEIEPTGGTSSKKRKSKSQEDGGTESFEKRSPDSGKKQAKRG